MADVVEDEREALTAIYEGDFEVSVDPRDGRTRLWRIALQGLGAVFVVKIPEGYPERVPPSPGLEFDNWPAGGDAFSARMSQELRDLWEPGDGCVFQWAEHVKEALGGGPAEFTGGGSVAADCEAADGAEAGPGIGVVPLDAQVALVVKPSLLAAGNQGITVEVGAELAITVDGIDAEEPKAVPKEKKKAPLPKAASKKEPPREKPAAPEPAAEEEEAAPEGEEVALRAEDAIAEPDPRAHLNVVFIGHVDAGKSTTCGNILYLSGCVDERTIEKYMKEAKDKNRDSWFLAYIMDTSEEEKAKGKTVEVGRAHFETPNRRFTVLDAPGHKAYVPNMISGASQADIGVLIISARKGEFETGFEKGGQTREHALLAKTLGVDKLVLAINKMDDRSVEWAQSRFDEIVQKMSPFLKTSGFKDEQVMFLPISGLTGDNIKERKKTPAWFTGKTLLDLLDSIDVPQRSKDLPLRIPMLDGFKDMGATIAIGKVEQGTVRPGQKVIVMPINKHCTVQAVYIKDEGMKYACCGENVTLKMSGISESELSKGYVMCDATAPAKVVNKFKAQLQIIELPDERPVMTSGYKAILHVHVANEECEILKLYESMSMADRKKKEKNPRFARAGIVLTCSIKLARSITVDTFKGVQQLARFTLRDEGRTIAIGKITELPQKDGK